MVVWDSLTKMLRNLPDLYDKESGSNISKLLGVDAEQIDEFANVVEDVKDAHHIDIATGVSLDYLGSLVACVRYSGETDSSFRSRIKGQIANYIGGGTIESIKYFTSGYVGVSFDDVEVLDGSLVTCGWGPFITLLHLEDNLTDYFGNHNGIGSPVYVPGYYGKGVLITDPASYQIQIANHADFITADFSICMWVKFTSLPSGTGYLSWKGPSGTPGASNDWYIRVTNTGLVEVYIDCLTTDCVFDTGSDLLVAGQEYFIMLTWDDSENEARLYIGKPDELTLTKYINSSSVGVRQSSPGDIQIGEDFTGWIDEWMYDDSTFDNFAVHVAFGATTVGLDTYAHFSVAIFNWDADSKIQPGDVASVIAIVNVIKAAGVKCDYVGPAVKDDVNVSESWSYNKQDAVYEDSVSVSETADHYHYADITYTDSLNIVG